MEVRRGVARGRERAMSVRVEVSVKAGRWESRSGGGGWGGGEGGEGWMERHRRALGVEAGLVHLENDHAAVPHGGRRHRPASRAGQRVERRPHDIDSYRPLAPAGAAHPALGAHFRFDWQCELAVADRHGGRVEAWLRGARVQEQRLQQHLARSTGAGAKPTARRCTSLRLTNSMTGVKSGLLHVEKLNKRGLTRDSGGYLKRRSLSVRPSAP